MSNCINSGINKVYVLTQFTSQSLNRHLARTYNFGNGVTVGDGFVEVCRAITGGSWIDNGMAVSVCGFIPVTLHSR